MPQIMPTTTTAACRSGGVMILPKAGSAQSKKEPPPPARLTATMRVSRFRSRGRSVDGGWDAKGRLRLRSRSRLRLRSRLRSRLRHRQRQRKPTGCVRAPRIARAFESSANTHGLKPVQSRSTSPIATLHVRMFQPRLSSRTYGAEPTQHFHSPQSTAPRCRCLCRNRDRNRLLKCGPTGSLRLFEADPVPLFAPSADLRCRCRCRNRDRLLNCSSNVSFRSCLAEGAICENVSDLHSEES